MRKYTLGRFLLEFGGLTIVLVVTVLLALPYFGRAREASRRSSCQANLKQMGIVCKMYSNESKGEMWPSRSPIPDNWIPDTGYLYPEYLSDLSILICPDSPFVLSNDFSSMRGERGVPDSSCVSSLFYTYTGSAMCSDEEAWALFESQSRDWTPENRDLELDVPVWQGSGRVLCGGQAGIPVMWDRVSEYDDEFSHTPLGINVLHMDGHVEFVNYSAYNDSSWFPATRVCAETFGSVLPRMPSYCYGD
ncbi:MAG: DUF1559 domain-containing protein [Candidatus Hydrogenedentes bacterium]|nr:DUF1559 domain-containing protein [Candidatus Hydrogenedentota bacterium]